MNEGRCHVKYLLFLNNRARSCRHFDICAEALGGTEAFPSPAKVSALASAMMGSIFLRVSMFFPLSSLREKLHFLDVECRR